MADNRAQQIDLLFGVKGGSKLGGESGKNIKSQIDGIVKQLNHSPYTISIKANETELIKIEQRLDNIRSEITSMPALDIGVAGGGENDLTKLYDKVVKRVESVATKNLKLPELNANLSETKTYLATVERLDKLSRSFMDSDGLVKDMGSLDASAIADMKEYMRVSELVNNQIRAADIATKALAKSTKQASTESMSAAKMLNKVYTSYNKFTNIKDYKKFNDEYQNLINELSGKTSLTGEEVKDVTRRINELENACFAAGVQADTLGEAIEHKISDRLKYLIGQFAIDFVVQGLRRIYDNVLQIDSAMTELKKVTDETGEAYDRFLTNAGKRAKELGASLVEVVNMTADYARLGYDVDEASNLADAAIIYRNVGDGLKNADEATDHLISTMKAFGVEASNSMRIVDAFNEVSNNFAVTSSDIGAGLQRSSAAMAAAGNSMEETIALFTAGNTIIRDADTMGTSLKTISMRLRSTKSDLEAMGEDADGAAENVSSLRKELLALTGVDIQLDENTYKNTYEILQELSKVWDNLDDLTQANVLEKLFGKRQPNVGAAILQNFNIAEEALETAMNSAGSAVAENEKYLESIQGHLDQLTASFQTLSSNVLDSELIKTVVDILRGIIDILNWIIEATDSLGIGAVGVAADIMLVAVALDACFGLKRTKAVWDFVGGIASLVKYFKALKVVSSAEALKGFGSFWLSLGQTAKAAEVLNSSANAAKEASKQAENLAKVFGEKGAAGIVKFVTALAPVAPLLIALAALMVPVGIGIKATFDATVENQLKDIEEAKSEYKGLKSEVDELSKSYEENKKRIEELNSIGVKTTIEQEELDRLELENELLDAQIKYKEKLLAIEKRDIVDETQDAFYNTFGYGKKSVFGKEFYTKTSTYGSTQGYNNSAYLDSYKQIVEDITKYEAELDAEYSKDPTEQSRKRISELEKLKTEAESLEAEMLANLLQWRNDLAGETDEISVSIVDAINRVVYGVSAEGEMKNILLNDGFSDIIDFLVDHTEITSIDQLTAKLAESFGIIFEPGMLEAFKTALEAAGYALDDVRQSAQGLRNESPIDIEASITIDTEAIEKASEATKTLSSSCKAMADAFKEQNENGALSVDTILDVIDAGYAAALVVDQETGAVKLNAAMYLELAKAKIAQQIIDLQNQRNSLANQLNLINEGKCANFAALGYATLEEAKKSVESHIAALDAQITALNNIDLSKVTQGIYGIGNAASSASSKLSKLQSGMENLLSQTISWLKQEYNDAQEAQENYYESQIDALEDAKDAAKDRWNAEKEAIEDAKDSYNDLIDAQIELLKRQKEADDYAKSRAEKEDAVADIENQLLAIENDDSIEAQKMRLELQEQLKEAKDELEELQSDREYELREQALQDEKDRYNDEVDAKLDAIEKQSEAEQKAYQDRIDRLRKYLDAVRDSEKTEAQWRAEAYDWIENREEELYQNLIEWNRIYGDGRDSTVEQWFKEAEGWRAWGDTFAEARENLARYLYELAEAIGGVAAAVTEAEETAAEKMQALLEQIAEYRDKYLAEGNEAMAMSMDLLSSAMQSALENELELSSEMIEAMKKALSEGDNVFLNTVRRMMEYYNTFKDNGTISIASMSQFFNQAMVKLNEDQQIVLQAMYNNILEVTKAAIAMNDEINSAHSAPNGPHGNGLVGQKVLAYAEGGVVDYTGPAAVHGSKSHPEVVFNADAAAKLYNYVVNTPDLLKSAFAGITADSSMLKGASQINNAPSIGDININISGNADADTVLKFKQLAGQLRDEVVKSLNDSMNRRGIMRSPRVI